MDNCISLVRLVCNVRLRDADDIHAIPQGHSYSEKYFYSGGHTPVWGLRSKTPHTRWTNALSNYSWVKGAIGFFKCRLNVLTDLLSPSDLVLFLNLRKEWRQLMQ